jgi:hypothetical protein
VLLGGRSTGQEPVTDHPARQLTDEHLGGTGH